jgi:hypothetical protein
VRNVGFWSGFPALLRVKDLVRRDRRTRRGAAGLGWKLFNRSVRTTRRHRRRGVLTQIQRTSPEVKLQTFTLFADTLWTITLIFIPTHLTLRRDQSRSVCNPIPLYPLTNVEAVKPPNECRSSKKVSDSRRGMLLVDRSCARYIGSLGLSIKTLTWGINMTTTSAAAPSPSMDPAAALPVGDPLMLNPLRPNAPLTARGPATIAPGGGMASSVKPLRPIKERQPVATAIDLGQVRRAPPRQPFTPP